MAVTSWLSTSIAEVYETDSYRDDHAKIRPVQASISPARLPNLEARKQPRRGQRMQRIGIIVGSTRQGRLGAEVAHWVRRIAVSDGRADYELVDLRDYDLPLFDEAVVPMVTPGVKAHTRRWSEAIAGLDGFVIVTPEYNHGIPAALKNAIDFLYTEWNDKAVGFVGYGADGAVRAVEHLRGVMGMVRAADVAPQVTLSLATDFKDYREFAPAERRRDEVITLLSSVISWSTALETLRRAPVDRVLSPAGEGR
jgi:NAD(P)H-dependent FMN reductase